MLPTFDLTPTVLEGVHVRLEPLELRHADDLLAAAQDDSIWLYMPILRPRTPADMEAAIAAAHAGRDAGRNVPFAIIHQATGRTVGSTRYLDVDRTNRSVEVGWTWLGVAAQRTAVNTECKYLLLRHAFEDHGALRVQLKTDGRNERSQRAIARIGAKYEGTLRKHWRMPDGHLRDTVYFSVIAEEWPEVKAGLEAKLAARAPA